VPMDMSSPAAALLMLKQLLWADAEYGEDRDDKNWGR